MKEIERAAIMRVVSDVIRADNIIDVREMSFLDEIRIRYGITFADQQKAFTMSLASAIEAIQLSNDELKQCFVEEIKAAVMSDNLCSRQEAVMLLMLTACFDESFCSEASMVSVKQNGNVVFDDAQILYVEGEYNSMCNTNIDNHFDEIVDALRLIGYNFVFLPKVAEHYKQLTWEELQSMLQFLYPNTSQEQRNCVGEQIKTLTTTDFCHEHLAENLAMERLHDTPPALLIKTGYSIVDGHIYDNFMLMVIDESPIDTIRKLRQHFVRMFQPRIINPSYESAGRFAFHGFHKQVLDAFFTRRGVRSTVVIDILRGEISLPQIGACLRGLHRREKALYALFLLESYSGGINFNRPENPRALAKYERRMEAIQRKYEIIYQNFGGETSTAPRLDDSKIRLPMISHIKRQLRSLGESLTHSDDYIIQRNMYGNYSVRLSPELCLCIDCNTPKASRFTESDFWKRLLAM